jgi:Uma2 family endonuclease
MSIAPARPIPTYPEPGESSTFEVTYDDYMAMPETSQHVEIVDGVIYVMSGPTFGHQEIVIEILAQLRPQVRRSKLGLLLVSPADVIIRKQPKLRVRQPDLLFFSNERAGFDASSQPSRVQQANRDGTLAPALVIEVLSPGQNERTLSIKLGDYASIEVDEVWFADQEAKSIRILGRDGDGYRLAGEYQAGDALVSAVLPGIQLDLGAVFGS